MNTLSEATTSYLLLTAQMFDKRRRGEEEGDGSDLDAAWAKMTVDERETMNAICKLLSTLED